MRVISRISVDLSRPNTGSRIDAVQWDENTRCVEISLFSNGVNWEAPMDAEAAVAYAKPDRTMGLYSKLPDGSDAVMVNGSTVTVTLARQMLTAPGIVNASVVFNNAAMDQLTTFPFTVHVQPSVYNGQEPSQDYIRLQWLEEKLAEQLQAAKESGAFDGPAGPQGQQGVQGPVGPQGGIGPQGPRGDAYFATFSVDDDGHLRLIGGEDLTSVTFRLTDTGNLEVTYA